jgi:hypothetical protein
MGNWNVVPPGRESPGAGGFVPAEDSADGAALHNDDLRDRRFSDEARFARILASPVKSRTRKTFPYWGHKTLVLIEGAAAALGALAMTVDFHRVGARSLTGGQ